MAGGIGSDWLLVLIQLQLVNSIRTGWNVKHLLEISDVKTPVCHWAPGIQEKRGAPRPRPAEPLTLASSALTTWELPVPGSTSCSIRALASAPSCGC